MSEGLVYSGLRCIGAVRDAGRQYEAWGEPGREGLGRFNTHEQACRAIYDHDRQRTAAAVMSEVKQPTRQERWAAKNPLARWAHSATRSTVRRGLIVRQVCQVCGDPKTDAHYPDHCNPLEVTWLCRRHHKAEHRKLAEGG